ncbi:nicotinate phosphoribosyltransferase [candidate division MSBL1 archaeon SCGC-AAA261O19]|uniref:nicotinate phosphoribosyltransferase n=2 Tax=candidate division MSBL1 TaxID=215777 RepID=A0A133V2C7_9EURY|nr:nicotinate phosphoribosyltransferase [candidate division MSBL1 archaeon SCGC-AAA261C02]KXB03690.1 nicotinate phosphoribosyltransferase [candidate division MSBL1 archaeon SCGC-AAA261O19]
MKFHVASDEQIKAGETTDVYFSRTQKILKEEDISDRRVVAEVTAGSLPRDWQWAIFCGIDEVAQLFEGYPVNVWTIPEGKAFKPVDYRRRRVPLIVIEGPYGDFCTLETPMLGLTCQASGVATMAARVRRAAADKLLLAFGIRRMHPALAPMLDRAAYIGGCDGVSSLIGAEAIDKEPMGTMPHGLIIAMRDQVKAWKAFDKHMPEDVPRIALVDTYSDEKVEALKAAEALEGKLDGVRLDTPGSRKGSFPELVREIRWELDLRGYEHVDIIVSGGLDEYKIPGLVEAGADSFGVGTSISNAPVLNLAMDIVEVEGEPAAKRGKLGGRKQVWRCPKCMVDMITPIGNEAPKCPECGGKTESLLEPLIEGGELVKELPSPDQIRESVLNQLENLTLD